MKRIATLRDGLARIGALSEGPDEPGVQGPDPAVESLHIVHVPDESRTIDLVAEAEGDGSSTGEELEPVFEIGPEIEQAVAAMNGEAGERIRQSVLVTGVDALGYYIPFHVAGLQWGVYVKVSGLIWMAARTFRTLDVPVGHKAVLAFHSILSHELFHFATEVAVARAELLFAEPWYLKASRSRRSQTPPYLAEEEALANAYMLARFKSSRPEMRVRGKQERLKAFVNAQPIGYRDGLAIGPADWAPRLEDLMAIYGAHGNVAAGRLDLWGRGAVDWAAFYPIVPRVPWQYCPIHLVDDQKRHAIPSGSIRHFARLENIQETDGFVKMLRALPGELQFAWEQQKARLAQTITRGADLKPWPPGGDDVYSVRVNKSYRAHLRYRRDARVWMALEIGSHTAMGHG